MHFSIAISDDWPNYKAQLEKQDTYFPALMQAKRYLKNKETQLIVHFVCCKGLTCSRKESKTSFWQNSNSL